jgi:hypothetical protein
MTAAVNTTNFSDTNDLKFRTFKSELVNQVDVYYKEQRIAIINGLSAPLKWTAKNGSNIPNQIIDRIEKLVIKNLIN